MDSEQNFAVSTLLETPAGIPLVLDPLKPEPRYWKFPGGRSKPGETPLETAKRELLEETGVEINEDSLVLVFKEKRTYRGESHDFYFFKCHLEEDVQFKERGNDGELIKIFPFEEIKKMADFFPPHRELLLKL